MNAYSSSTHAPPQSPYTPKHQMKDTEMMKKKMIESYPNLKEADKVLLGKRSN